jgi:DNA helicase-2/ATP-dependent DNA helicase PcrA
MINKILKPLIAELTGNDVEITDNSVFSAISTAKSKNISPEEMALQLRQGRQPPDPKKLLIHQVYAEYQENLRRTNSLDFDDLLVYGVRLFERNATLSSWCRHVLVDELYVQFCSRFMLPPLMYRIVRTQIRYSIV